MEDSTSPRPPRRKRYSGKNPRRFEDKYKEHAPGAHGETVAKVLASGKTPAGMHVPIMVTECLEALALQPGQHGIDATLGYGGHAREILARISPGGHLIGLDVDPIEQPKTEARLRELSYAPDSFQAIRSNYAGIRKALDSVGWDAADFVFGDLGCSSMQFDNPSRGFTFKVDGPLDMRMNPQRGVPASEWLAKVKPAVLAEALRENADEPRAEEIAAALAGKHLTGTLDLAKAIRSLPQLAKLDEERLDLTVRRAFQAIRIAVNEEFTALDSFLRVLPSCLKPGGHAAILTFHSGEDRRVKKAFQAGLRDGLYSTVSENVIVAGPEERRANPRSIPAKLRQAIRA
ncbi:16S rRNA (cytosine(1402)-N(4))-methyltransferase RsmH [Luteolibacter sp. GHJ8]|uniref:Ribosomal RNA small subunit methyltransferase H n=1 Tax=Luteolibacter rhizosphaerae TaxID=2989719 RepID=A0ABT3G2Y8_9BACT|nr:16S rRNA (cytosine(1402)-N(4))-methyltransferase RsmH [Luteolibacter rhizosphaerae]MCW1914226.1 16S rRNA (cytosine(1402)-N(4))-methyltransferase RsmH [Luteolibacter rhizosphaerae]